MASGNPYVGPGPFRGEDRDSFCGRDLEARHLRALVSSEEIVLFYAQSGAGKTSLVHARLVKDLRDKSYRVDVVTPAELAGQRLAGFPRRGTSEGVLADHDGDTQVRRRVLVVDQFEELLTTHPERRDERAGFFEQLQEAVDADPRFAALLVMREDRIAGLDEYVPLVRNRLQARFRMERLRRDAALEAIRKPAEHAGRPFADEVAEELVHDLSRERVVGRDEPVEGGYVEPLQLQVVCYQLWESLPEDGKTITRGDVEAFGDVDRALEDFYRDTVEEVCRQAEVGEEEVRRWFEEALITPQGLRARVAPEGDRAGDLPVKAVELLEQKHLVRAETSLGGTWYQLIHDRFVEPIRASNARWLARHSGLAAAARDLEDGDRSVLAAYRGRRLRETEEWAGAHPRLVADRERRFLAAARASDLRRWQLRTAGLTALLIFVVGFFSMLISLRGSAMHLAEARVQLGQTRLDTDPAESLRMALEVVDGFFVTPSDQTAAEVLLRDGLYAFRLRPLWRADTGEVSAFAWSSDGRRLATAHAETADDGEEVHPVRVWDGVSGRLIVNLNRDGPRKVPILALNADGTRLAAAPWGGRVELWNVDRATRAWARDARLEQRVYDVSFRPDGRLLEVSFRDGIELWDAATGEPDSPAVTAEPPGDDAGEASVEFEVFSEDGRYLVAVTSDGSVTARNVASDEEVLSQRLAMADDEAPWHRPSPRHLARATDDGFEVREILFEDVPTFAGHSTAAVSIAFDRAGRRLATASSDHTVKLWDVSSRQLIWSRKNRGGIVPRVALSPDGTRVAGIDDGKMVLWDASSGAAVPTGLVREEVEGLAFSPDERHLAFHDTTTVYVWEIGSGDAPTECDLGSLSFDLTFSFDGKLLAAALDNHTAVVWPFDACDPRVLEGHQDPVTAVAFSPEGLLATASDRTVMIWDSASGEFLRSLEGHDVEPVALAFSSDGRLLASAGQAEVFLWDPRSGQRRSTVPVRARTVSDVAFHPDGSLAIADAAAMVRLEPLSIEALVDLARDRTGEPTHVLLPQESR